MDYVTPLDSKKEAVGVTYKDRLLGRVGLAGSAPGSHRRGRDQERLPDVAGISCSGDTLYLDLFCPTPALVSPLILCIHQAEQVEGLALR